MADIDSSIAAPDISSPAPGGDSPLAAALGASQPASPQPAAPDMGSGLPADMPSSSNLGGTPQPSAPPLNPKLNRTFLNTLKGLALGFMQGNIPGAIQGAIDPSVPERVQQQQRAVMSAQTADVLAKARVNELNAQALPQEIRDRHDANVLNTVKYLTETYGAPDETFDNSSDAAHEALQNHVTNGNVPLGHVLSDSNTTYVWHADKAVTTPNAYNDVHNAGVLNGNPALSGITQDQWNAMSANDKSSTWATARQILTPVAPSADPKARQGQILSAQRQLQTVQAMPDIQSKAGLVKFAQNNLDVLNAADNDPKFADKIDENQRSTFLRGIQSETTLPPDLKKTYTQFVQQAKTGAQLDAAVKTVTEDIGKYQTGVDSAKQKAADKAAEAQAAGGGEWKPKVTADEKKKAELAENIAFNANEVNSMLAKRPDLVGAVSGRYTNVQQMIGNNDPSISAIGNEIHNIAMANSGVHGFRSQEGVQETEANILNHFKNGPQAVAGALKSNTDSVQTFIDNARPETYGTHSKSGGAVAYWQKQSQQKPQTQSGGGGAFQWVH